MPGVASPVIAGDALARGLSNLFDHTWQRRYKGVEERMGSVIELGVPSNLFSPLFGYYETAPYIERRPFGEGVKIRGFRARNFSVEQISWDIAVTWKKEDRIFDQLKSLERRARQAGENAATLPERVAFQLMRGATDNSLLPALPNAPDGAALYSATDGASADRFGVSGGNVLTGGGVATSQAVRNDFFDAIERFSQFQDPQGQPALDQGLIDGGVTLFFGIANSRIFREAFSQSFTLQTQAGTTATQIQVGAAVSNVILDSGLAIRLVGTPRITDNDWFIFLDKIDLRPIFQVIATPLTETVQVEENSDIARRYKEEGVFYNTIQTYGCNLPLGTVQVNN